MTSLLAGVIGVGAVLAAAAPFPHRTRQDTAENARWVVHSASWGYLTELDSAASRLSAMAVSFSDGAVGNSTGRLFFFLMGRSAAPAVRPASLTISEAELNTTCGNRDPEDPRCAKITLSGMLQLATGADAELGRSALFARHPQMQSWPKGHHFEVFELHLSNIWMIDFYGGGGDVKVSDFLAAQAKHNVPAWPPHPHLLNFQGSEPPPWNQTAARARWLVYHSIWGSLGTISVHLEGAPWGGMRSVADGLGENSTGLPVLYIPSPDPLAINLGQDSRGTLSFSEAALTERLSSAGTCGGADSEDPTCAQITLSGRLRPLSKPSEVDQAMVNLAARHPLAPWLAQGGAHTGGQYYTIDIENIMFLDFYGGPADLSVADYLAAATPHAHADSADNTFFSKSESALEELMLV